MRPPDSHNTSPSEKVTGCSVMSSRARSPGGSARRIRLVTAGAGSWRVIVDGRSALIDC
jgi:hypothetical protein